MKRRLEEEDAIVPMKHNKLFEMPTESIEAVPQINEKRGCEGMDEIDFSPLKRRRCMDQSQQNELDPIFFRIVGWVREQQQRGSLPKTTTKLARAIAPMCRAMVHIDCQVVFYHLLLNQVLLVEKNTDNSSTYFANPNPIRRGFYGIVPDDVPSAPFSDEFVNALERSTTWILSNRGLKYYKSENAILSSLKQICTMRKEISPEHVVDLLIRRGILCRGPQDEIQYGTDQNLVMSHSHYAPMYGEMNQ